jgi:hypothetical protein
VSRHATGAYPNNNHFSCLPRVERLTLATIFLQICKSTSTMTLTLGKVNEATKTTMEATIHDPPEEEERLRPIQEDKGPKVLKDRAKRTASDRHKTGRVSTHLVILDPVAQRARQVNLEPPTASSVSSPEPVRNQLCDLPKRRTWRRLTSSRPLWAGCPIRDVVERAVEKRLLQPPRSSP